MRRLIYTIALLLTATGALAQSTISNTGGITYSDDVTFLGALDTTSGTFTIASGTSLPGTCTIGELFIDTDADTDGSLYICRATNVWKEVDDDGGAGGGDVTAVGPACATGDCLTDGLATTGSTILVFEGTSVDANQLTINSASADPGSAVTVTIPIETGTVCTTGSVCTGYVTESATQTLTNKSISGDQIDSGTVPAARVGAGHIDATTELAGGLCGTNEILEDQGASWACIATPAGGGSGDAIEIEDGDNLGTFTTIDTTARFDDSGDINFTFADGGAGGPDVVTATVRADSVALTTDTTGNYAAGDAEAGAALTGDSATAFFSAGQIEAARGGTGIDSSALTGVARVNAGTWSADATLAHLGASTGQIDDDDLAAGAVDGGAGGEIADDSITFDDAAHTLTLAGNPGLAANQAYWSSTGVIFEGADDTIEGLLTAAPTTSDKTWTLPDATGTVAVSATAPITLSAAGAIGSTAATGAVAGHVSTGAQTFGGTKTFNGGISIPSGQAVAYNSAAFATLPQGTAPVVSGATGRLAIDTSGNGQIIFRDDGGDRVLIPRSCASAVIENLAAADDGFALGSFPLARTITDIGVHCDGTCSTPADIDLIDRAGNAMTHGAPTVSTGTGNTTFTSVTAANSLVAGEGLEMNVANAVSPETDTYTITFCWTVDRQ